MPYFGDFRPKKKPGVPVFAELKKKEKLSFFCFLGPKSAENSKKKEAVPYFWKQKKRHRAQFQMKEKNKKNKRTPCPIFASVKKKIKRPLALSESKKKT